MATESPQIACPECGGTSQAARLGDAVASVCDDCGAVFSHAQEQQESPLDYLLRTSKITACPRSKWLSFPRASKDSANT